MEFLNDMALFVEVCKVMSFRKAADNLNMPSSTLSRRISHLEKEIGLRLLHRTTRKVELTEAGQIYYERCRRIVEEARLAHEELGDILAQPTGLLRVSLPVDFAINYLALLLVEFADHYPGIHFEFDLTPRQVNLITEPFDLAIRMGEQKDSTLIARLLVKLPVYFYASPHYLEVSGEPKHPNDLIQHECLGFPKGGLWKLSKDDTNEKIEVNVKSRFMLNNIGMIKQLAVLNQGITLLPEGIVTKELDQGLLRKILPEWQGIPISVYALTETRLLPAKTQRFIEFLRNRLK
ncbi:LysR family transcriptional regulator [Acinetobacter sp. ANC 4173]|uniref:LysR family transcriptional regulator n=1 Tax=Acinetobacter sp. ANC 4173 TaxID=2529837 RepID=UPI00103FCCC3|nr:LysR family transcriptional regulator [Acinetobacter sp. ANC 4173]TCB73299.1 LysR family transcriptional regulator [Acinetobacter sp. ANC 4173]